MINSQRSYYQSKLSEDKNLQILPHTIYMNLNGYMIIFNHSVSQDRRVVWKNKGKTKEKLVLAVREVRGDYQINKQGTVRVERSFSFSISFGEQSISTVVNRATLTEGETFRRRIPPMLLLVIQSPITAAFQSFSLLCFLSYLPQNII